VKKLFAIFSVMLLLAGCNTIEGFGKDVKKAGQALENAARK
jgi:entericidin A